MKIGILTAMQEEFDQLASMLLDSHELRKGPHTFLTGLINEHTVVLMKCGIGKVNAACGTTQIIADFQPDCIISTGVAGGIDKCLAVMDVVVSDKVCHHDVWCGDGFEPGQVQGLPTFLPTSPEMVEKALGLNTGVKVHPGLICTGERFITDRAELSHIKAAFPQGLAVDMESASIAQVCYIYGIPFVSFRIISDTPGVEGHIQQYADFWTTMADKSFTVIRSFLESL